MHRVQRVPRTETKGRVHTSTVTLAVLPPIELAVQPAIDARHLKIETMRSTGAGGQHVNTTDSAVRITHLPTGISAMSSQRSQHRNKANALTCLRLRLGQHVTDAAKASRARQRAIQVSSAARTAKIRTYNFVQDRVTDHRLGTTAKGVAKVLAGAIELIVPFASC